MATNLIFNLPVSSFKQAPDGAFNMTPTITATHAAADTFQCYLGGLPTAGIASIKMQLNEVGGGSGTQYVTSALAVNADGVSATYTATGSEGWLTTAGQSWMAKLVVQFVGDTSGPGGTALNYYSAPVTFVTA